jgi:hypothetical protein
MAFVAGRAIATSAIELAKAAGKEVGDFDCSGAVVLDYLESVLECDARKGVRTYFIRGAERTTTVDIRDITRAGLFELKQN